MGSSQAALPGQLQASLLAAVASLEAWWAEGAARIAGVEEAVAALPASSAAPDGVVARGDDHPPAGKRQRVQGGGAAAATIEAESALASAGAPVGAPAAVAGLGEVPPDPVQSAAVDALRQLPHPRARIAEGLAIRHLTRARSPSGYAFRTDRIDGDPDGPSMVHRDPHRFDRCGKHNQRGIARG